MQSVQILRHGLISGPPPKGTRLVTSRYHRHFFGSFSLWRSLHPKVVSHPHACRTGTTTPRPSNGPPLLHAGCYTHPLHTSGAHGVRPPSDLSRTRIMKLSI